MAVVQTPLTVSIFTSLSLSLLVLISKKTRPISSSSFATCNQSDDDWRTSLTRFRSCGSAIHNVKWQVCVSPSGRFGSRRDLVYKFPTLSIPPPSSPPPPSYTAHTQITRQVTVRLSTADVLYLLLIDWFLLLIYWLSNCIIEFLGRRMNRITNTRTFSIFPCSLVTTLECISRCTRHTHTHNHTQTETNRQKKKQTHNKRERERETANVVHLLWNELITVAGALFLVGWLVFIFRDFFIWRWYFVYYLNSPLSLSHPWSLSLSLGSKPKSHIQLCTSNKKGNFSSYRTRQKNRETHLINRRNEDNTANGNDWQG